MVRALPLCALLLLVPAASWSGPSDDFRSLTSAEKRLVLRYFWQAPTVWGASKLALNEAKARYPQLSGQDDQRDAFRHSLWNGSMTRRLKSERAAERWANAHEEFPGNPAARKAMDLANNSTGRQRVWAARTVSGPWWFRRTRFPDDAAIANDLLNAVDAGDLLMIEAVGGRRDPHAGRLVPTTTP